MNAQELGMLESERARFETVVQRWYFDDEPPPTPDTLMPLEGCTEPMSEKTCELLDLPVGSTYGDVVEHFAPNGMYVLDLHGYPVRQAVELAERMVKAAWEAGFEFIKVIHGAPDIRHKLSASVLGRGGIKCELRDCLSRGDWNQYVYPRRSRRHRIDDGSMILALRNGASANLGLQKEMNK